MKNNLLLLILFLFSLNASASTEYFLTANHYLTCGTTNHPTNTEDQTWSFWMQMDNTSTRQIPIAIGGLGGILSFEIQSNNVYIREYGGANVVSEPNTSNDWHHWAYTFTASSNTNKLYKDGVEVDSQTDPHPNNITSQLYFGAYPGFTYIVFDGEIDHFLLYDRVLSVAEIESLALSRAKLFITDGLVSGYRMDDEISNNTVGSNAVKDFSPSGNHCSATGTSVKFSESVLRY